MNTNNRSPIVPDDSIIQDVPVGQDQLIQLTVANTTAGALTYRARVELEDDDDELLDDEFGV